MAEVFGIIAAGRPPSLFGQVGDQEFIAEITDAESVNHIVVFVTQPFPDSFGGSVYIRWPLPNGQDVSWHYLGFICNSKPSAIFKVAQISQLHVSETRLHTGLFQSGLCAGTHGTAQVGIMVEPLVGIETRDAVEGTRATQQSTLVEFADKMVRNLVNYAESYTAQLPKPDGSGFYNAYFQVIQTSFRYQHYKNVLSEIHISIVRNLLSLFELDSKNLRIVSGNQLLTIGAKFLRVFRTNPYTLVPPKDANDEWQQKTKLECVYSCRMLAAVQSFSTARLPWYPSSDVLLLAFDDAKLSVVAVDERDRSLRTISLHSFEDEFLREGFTKNFPDPIVRADPANRCAAMLVYGRHLAVLPFPDGQSHIRSFTVSLESIDIRLDNIVDIVFLDGYYEPTLLFLYEPLQTTAGRASIRYDTMCIMGVSVNVFDKQIAVVWQLGSLPMDCNRLLSVPKPVGGALVFGSNEVIYLNQAVPPCGIVLNSCFDNFTKFPLKDLKSMSMTLDASASEWLGGEKVAVGASDGRLFILSLITDSANTVKSLDIKHVYGTSVPYCITLCAPGHLFIGSRLGDSQLLEYTVTRKESGLSFSLILLFFQVVIIFPYTSYSVDELGESKRSRVEEAVPHLDEEDMELYGQAVTEQIAAETVRVEEELSFRELDRLTNIGPIKTMTAGGAHDTSQLLLDQNRIDPVFDIVRIYYEITIFIFKVMSELFFLKVTASGHGNDGSICVLQRTIRPEVITSSSLDGAQQMWAVGRREDDSHKYLIVSRTRSTLVLELGEEMVELEDPLFITSEPTVAAGELADGGLAVQVTSMCLALVADGQQLQEVQLDSNFPVVSVSIVDPFVALLTQNGRLLLFQLASQPHVHLKEIDLSQSPFDICSQSPLTAISIYRDMSGMMVCSTGNSEDHEGGFQSIKERVLVDADDADLYGESAILEDAEDLLLYGESAAKKAKKGVDRSRKRKRKGAVTVTAASGGEQSDAVDPNTAATAESSIEQAAENVRLDERIVEVQIIGLFLKYGVLTHIFSVVFHKLFLRNGNKSGTQTGKEAERQRSIIHTFERVSSVMNGVLITGAFPCMVVMGAWGGLRHHPLTLDGPIRAFTPFNNQNVLNGFLYLTDTTQELRIAKLQSDFDYDLPYPCKKVPVGATVHHVRYMMQSQVYAVTTSVPQKSNKIWVVVNDDKQVETHEKNDNFVLPEIQQYTLNLYSPEDWGPVPNTEIGFEEMEVVTACEEVALRSESTLSGMQTYLAVGTINNYGEEVLIRGRIILSEIIEVVPEPGQPTSKHKIKV
uniref:MMS1_N domain-containing protein n=1 Tax=Heterorhabditis bacteriophora TaxID=37862 RepID=A0A1I7WN59_HETBA